MPLQEGVRSRLRTNRGSNEVLESRSTSLFIIQQPFVNHPSLESSMNMNKHTKSKQIWKPLTGAAVAAAAVAAMALGAGATAASAAPTTDFTTGHTDIVSVACDSDGELTVNTFREDIGYIPQGTSTIGDYRFLFDQSDSPDGAITFNEANQQWTISGDEALEDEIPFVGFQYTRADSAEDCPASVSFDVSKVEGDGAVNDGDATFVGNESVTGSTSSADGNTDKVTVWRPGTPDKPSHEHGPWYLNAPAEGGDFTLKFNTYRGNNTTPEATVIEPVHFRVQP